METGKVSGNVLKRSVLGQISTKREDVVSGAGIGGDCAIFSCAGEERLVTCMQEAAVCWVSPQMRVSAENPELQVSKPRQTKLESQESKTDCTKPESQESKPDCTKPESQESGQKDSNPELPINAPECLDAETYMTLAHLIQKCANNIAAGGARPVALLLTLLLPECTEEADIKALMAEARRQCGELTIALIGGQTRITGQVRVPFAVAAGYGKAGAEGDHTVKAAAPGQDLVISKWIGLQGTAVLAKRNQEKLLKRYPRYLVEEAAGFDRYLSIIPEAAAAVKSGVCAMHDASEGGIFAALWELAEGAGVGLNIDMRKLPLRQETVEVCECCNVNPYELLSGGCLIMTACDGQALVDALAAEHIPAVIVGRVTEGKARILRNGEEFRYLDRPKQDQIYKGQ